MELFDKLAEMGHEEIAIGSGVTRRTKRRLPMRFGYRAE